MLNVNPHNDNQVKSPCRGICTLDKKGKCIGCFRTLDEIANWRLYTDSEKREILKMVHLRMLLPDIFD